MDDNAAQQRRQRLLAAVERAGGEDRLAEAIGLTTGDITAYLQNPAEIPRWVAEECQRIMRTQSSPQG